MRIALGVEYDGRAFSGWEIQKERETVQAVLEAALSNVADHPLRTTCAGRTDAGVHAWGQVVHFESGQSRPLHAWVLGTNTVLPSSVSVSWAQDVPDEFHARFSAKRRHYRYLILNRAARSGLLDGRVGWESRPLDIDSMQEGANRLLGEHDFSAFRAAGCQAKSPVRSLYRLEVRRRDQMIAVDVVANAFLQHMVRNVVGSLVQVGLGKQPPVWITTLLESRDRTRGGATMAAYGLYLVAVEYPARYGLPTTLSPGFSGSDCLNGQGGQLD